MRNRGPGLQVQEDRGELDPGQAVGHRVVQHLEQRDATALEPVDQPDVPERPGAVERARHQLGTQFEQLGLRAGPRQRGLVDVAADVEIGVVHPDRRRLPEHREPDDLAQLRHEVQPALHLGPHVLEPQAPVAVVQRTTLEDPDEAHVHGGVVRLHVEEGRIERGQGVGRSGHVGLGVSGSRAEQTSAKPSSMHPASLGLSGTAATSAVMVTQARSAADTRDTLSAAPDGGDTA